MAITVYTNNQHYADIAEAIRNKNGSSTQYKPSEMAGAINALIVSGATPNLQAKTVNPTTSSQVIGYDNGYNGLSQVTVNAISPIKTVNDLTVSGATVTIPKGWYGSNVSKSVATGTAGTPVATKGEVANNAITITPSVTNTAGYIPSSTKTGNAIIVNASELVSGELSITSNGTKDVTNYASVKVNIPTGSTINNQDKTVSPSVLQQTVSADAGYTGLGTVTVNAVPTMTLPTAVATSKSGDTKATIGRSTAAQYINIPIGYNSTAASYTISAIANGSVANPTAAKGTVSNNQISITPSVTSTTGYITGGTKTGTAVTVTASELVSGNKAITANGTNIDVKNYATVSVNVPSSGTTINNQDKTITPTTSQQIITADSGYTGLGTVTVDAIETEIGHAVTNGILTPSNGKLFSSVIVNVSSINLSQDQNGYLIFNNGNSGVSHNLPSAYQELLYINGEANGAVINTGINPDNTTYANLKVKPIAATGDVLFGTKGSGDGSDWRLFNYTNKIYWDCWSSRIFNASFPLLQTKDLQISNNRVMDLATGEIIDAGTEVTNFTVSTNIFINGGSASQSAKGHWYYVQIFKKGVKVRDFIPCYRKSDNVCGMYDLVTSSFYSSVGSGQFAAGSLIN